MSNGGRRADRRLHGGEIGHVHDERLGLVTALAQRRRRFLDFVARARGERDLRAGFRKRGREAEAEPTPGAGHQRALAVEAEGGRLWQLDCRHSRCHRDIASERIPPHLEGEGWVEGDSNLLVSL